MFKILVVIRSIGNLEGGRAVSQQLIEFDLLQSAQYAFDQLNAAKNSEWTVVKLWK